MGPVCAPISQGIQQAEVGPDCAPITSPQLLRHRIRRQIVKQADPRSDDEQPIRELMHVQRKVFCSRRETQMHEPITAVVTRPPRAAFNSRVTFKS